MQLKTSVNFPLQNVYLLAGESQDLYRKLFYFLE